MYNRNPKKRVLCFTTALLRLVSSGEYQTAAMQWPLGYCIAALWLTAFGDKCPPTVRRDSAVRVAGLWGWGLGTSHYFVGWIIFRSTCASPTYQAAGTLAVRRLLRVVLSLRSFGCVYHFALCRGANIDWLVGK